MKNYYRPEIDGLRAIAVLSVIFFHAGISIFKGGFVGVDIFFVISGYLISTIILKDIEKKNFNINYFYQRRARRILPALIITIALTIPFALVLLPPEDLQNFSKSIISSLTFWSNFQFSFESGYFETSGEYKPLLHTWSLSIEEQFYIFYPLFFILFFKLGKKFLFLAICTVSILSLFFAQWSGNLNYTYPFFDEELLFFSKSNWSEFMMPFGRVWELAFGAICAFLLNSKNNYFQKNLHKENTILIFNLFSFVGIFLILFSFFYLSENFPYPSFYSLMPVVGTVLLILFCNKSTIIQKILSFKILVFIGLISYSAYLFHFPVFSLARYTDINNLNYLYIVPLILLASFFNWKFIEKPFRKKNASLKKLLIFIIFSYLILILISFYIIKNEGLNKREKFVLPESIEDSFIISKKGKNCFDINYIHKKENKDKICKIGDINKKEIDFLIFGDSHIISFYNLFDTLAQKFGKTGLFVGYSACPPIMNVHTLLKNKERNCNKLNKLVFDISIEKNIKNLILISRWTYYTDGKYSGSDTMNYLSLRPSRSGNKETSRKAFAKGIFDTLEAYNKLGKNVYIIEQPPLQITSAKTVYYRSLNSDLSEFKNNLSKNSVKMDKHIHFQMYVKKIFNKALKNYKNLTLMNLDDVFCDKKINKCLIGNEKKSFYSDYHHLTSDGANMIENKIVKVIKSF
mgnify:FL=1